MARRISLAPRQTSQSCSDERRRWWGIGRELARYGRRIEGEQVALAPPHLDDGDDDLRWIAVAQQSHGTSANRGTF
jgi:hypothetical protein